jgi:dihydroneopterin aldolase
MTPKGDRIEVRGLRVMGVHGHHEDERVHSQPFEVDLDLELDTTSAARSDDLADTADYAAVIDAVAAVLAGPPHRLLESLASAIADAVLAVAPADSVTVGVRKLHPPVPYEVRSTGVRIVRLAPSGPDSPANR